MKYFISLVILLIFFIQLRGQQPAFRKYGFEDGLPEVRELGSGFVDDTIYVSFLDSKFYYFDGIKFRRTNYPFSNNYLIDIYRLKKGLKLKDNNLDVWYRKTGASWKKIPFGIKSTVFDSVFYSFNKDAIYVFDENNKDWNKFRDYPIEIDYDKLGVYFTLNGDNKKIVGIKNKDDKLLFDFINNEFITDTSKWKYSGFIKDKPLYFNTQKSNVRWEFCDSLLPVKNNITDDEKWMSFKYNNNTQKPPFSFIISEGNKKHFYTLDTFCNLVYSGTLNLAASKISKIREDMYFITSFGGIYKVNPFISYFTKSNSGLGINISSIVSHNGNIWVGGYGSGISKRINNNFAEIKTSIFDGQRNNVLPGAKTITENDSWFFKEGSPSVLRLKNDSIIGYETIVDGVKTYATGYFIDTLNDGALALGLNKFGLGIVDSIENYKIYIHSIGKAKGNNLQNVLTFDQDKNNRIWMGRYSTGVAVYDVKKDTAITFDNTLEKKNSFGVLSMHLDKFDQLWLGSNKGLYLLKNASAFNIYKDDVFKKAIKVCLPNNDNSTVFAIKETKKYIVIGNLTAISFIPKRKYGSTLDNTEIHQLVFGEDINDIGVQQNGMYYDNERFLWVAVLEGLLRIDVNGISVDTSGVKLIFDKIKNGDSELKIINGKIQIDPVKRNLRINFTQNNNISFLNNTYFDYILINNKSDTIAYQFRKKKNFIAVDYLHPGKYELIVKAFKNGIKKAEISLNINAPYTIGENPWIRSFILFILLSIITAYLYYRRELSKRKANERLIHSKLENEKEKLKIQAIISNFNPHFINNSLHWVQSRYYKDKELTNMVGKLSENINYILNKTKVGNAYHNLQEELRLVNNYITIQRIRFNNRFDYRESILLKDIETVNVIVMQIQIHVENSIEHGLRNRIESSFVEVEIKEDDSDYIITIKDDGIGRIKAKKMGSRGTSSGVKMLQELYDILNQNKDNNRKIKSYYVDGIFENNGLKYGTEVTILIPKKYNFTI